MHYGSLDFSSPSQKWKKLGVICPYTSRMRIGSLETTKMTKFDVRKIRRLTDQRRYGELYFHWRQAEQMIASSFPDAQRHGKRLKRRIEHLYSEWFGRQQPAQV